MHDGKSFIVKILGLPLLVALILSYVFLFIELEPNSNDYRLFDKSVNFLSTFLIFNFFIMLFVAPIELYMERRLANKISSFILFNVIGFILVVGLDFILFTEIEMKTLYGLFPLYIIFSYLFPTDYTTQ